MHKIIEIYIGIFLVYCTSLTHGGELQEQEQHMHACLQAYKTITVSYLHGRQL